MLKKILIIVVMLVLAAGIVSAIDIEEFEVPDGFEKAVGDYFENGKYEICIAPYSDSDRDMLFDDDEDYKVSEYTDHIYKYTDKFVKHVGAIEIVEIDGKKYAVECFKEDTVKDDGSTYDYLSEFNSLNDLSPVKP